MGNFLTIIAGITAVILGAAGLINWWDLLVKGLKAMVPIILIFGGLIALMAGISEMKDAAAAKKEEKEENK